MHICQQEILAFLYLVSTGCDNKYLILHMMDLALGRKLD